MTDPLADLFTTYHASLVRMLYRRTGDRERAEELAQETFARAVASPPTSPRAWLFAVALNLLRDEGRRTVRQERRLVLLKGELPASAPPPDAELERRECRDRVLRALDQLTPRDREALLLQAEGLSYAEIAEATGLAPGAVGTTLARARRRLVDADRALHETGAADVAS